MIKTLFQQMKILLTVSSLTVSLLSGCTTTRQHEMKTKEQLQEALSLLFESGLSCKRRYVHPDMVKIILKEKTCKERKN